ncbi:MAG: ACT domain-containing protein [Rhodoferax sp.]|nr:ACT domain-containing protein [Rhodoferax sp.]
MTPVTDLAVLLRTLQPVRNPGTYVFAQAPEPNTLAARDIVASVREPEGLSLVVEASVAARHGLQPHSRCAWITLHVPSDLQAVGLTAAFATALGEAGISCNVVAGLHHDHIFVPLPQADQAMATLLALQAAHAAAAVPGRAGP